jgi:hypothetical protein
MGKSEESDDGIITKLRFGEYDYAKKALLWSLLKDIAIRILAR